MGTKTKKAKHSNKSKKTISFEEEVVTRDEASKYLQESSNKSGGENVDSNGDANCTSTKKKRQRTGESEVVSDVRPTNDQDISEKTVKKHKHKRLKEQNSNSEEIPQESAVISESETPKKSKKRKKKESEKVDDSAQAQHAEEESQSPGKRTKYLDETPQNSADTGADNTVKGAPEKSKRLQKREKHLKLVEEKKLKNDLHMQQKALEYLSRWKHSRNTWRFEKLKQIWLQQNLFELSKIPSEFWDTVLEYFTSARGKVKSTLIQKALKIIKENKSAEPDEEAGDEEQNSDQAAASEQSEDGQKVASEESEDGQKVASEESEEDGQKVKFNRARDVVQYLQEE